MSEPKDSGIKLFGKTISMPEIPPCSSTSSTSSGLVVVVDDDNTTTTTHNNLIQDQDVLSSVLENRDREQATQPEKDIPEEKPVDTKQQDGGVSDSPRSVSSEKSDTTPCRQQDNDLSETRKTEEDEEEVSETGGQSEKTLKKPDKILPCPRCNSMDTKFCYYNNYNVNQPRHFCKKCQRYWTAGGTMRNVPVGAGRRKNKNNMSSHYHHITMSETLQAQLPNGPNHPQMAPNGRVLTFSSDPPLCESMASTLTVADKTKDGLDHHSYGSSKPTSKSEEEVGKSGVQDGGTEKFQSFMPQYPCFPGAPWPYPWNPAQWTGPPPQPAFFPPPQFYHPATFWSYPMNPGMWNMPCFVQPPSPSPNCPTLGKHSRDENNNKVKDSGDEETVAKESDGERSLWAPKTQRIGDPTNGSIWETLGIKHQKNDVVSRGGIFNNLQSKGGNEKIQVAETSPVLQANPAALSRSMKFHESF